MIIRTLLASLCILVLLLLLSHPTPFRTPDYLLRRARIPDSTVTKNTFIAGGDFDGNESEDSCYTFQPDSSSLGPELRFNHLIPSLHLSDRYDKIVHAEPISDVNNNGRDEIYIIVRRRKQCVASGILSELKNGRWHEIITIEQDGCIAFKEHGRLCDIIKPHQLSVEYKPSSDSDWTNKLTVIR